MLLSIFLAGVLSLGSELAFRLWRSERPDGEGGASLLEVMASAGIIASALAVGAGWLLSAFHLLAAPALTVFGLCACLVALLSHMRRRSTLGGISFSNDVIVPMLTIVPLLLFVIFVLWRGALLPALNHDAMSYHLPKAVMIMRNAGYGWFEAPDPRITTFASNYEMLIAEELILDGKDAVTEWLGTAMFLLFLASSVALVQRWWGSGRYLFGVPLLIASAPVVLLHAGADKNDLMAVAFFVSAVMWGARWMARGGPVPLALATVSTALGAGTKSHGCILTAVLVVTAAIVALRDRARRPNARQLAAVLALVVICVLLLGGIPYIETMLHRGLPIDARVTAQSAGGAPKPSTVEYGAWSNIVEFPALLWLAPFQRDARYVWIPWRHEAWFWPRYELFFSNYGEMISIAMLLIPFAIAWYRREGTAEERRERNTGTLVLLISAVLVMPLKSKPIGGFAAFPRYLAFTLPLIAGWSYAPLLRAVERRGRTAVLNGALVILCAAFTISAAGVVINDRFASLEYVLWTVQHRGSRRPALEYFRAGVVADTVAGPFDHIAFDTEFDSWIYPAYGAGLTRRVSLVPNGAGLAGVPPDADWVAVDRAWNMLWGHPRFRTYGDQARYIGEGRPTEGDVLLFRQLLGDPRYRLVFYLPWRNQALFQRVTRANRGHLLPVAPALADAMRELNSRKESNERVQQQSISR